MADADGASEVEFTLTPSDELCDTKAKQRPAARGKVEQKKKVGGERGEAENTSCWLHRRTPPAPTPGHEDTGQRGGGAAAAAAGRNREQILSKEKERLLP